MNTETVLTPETINEKLLYTTVRICGNSGSVGTGFFFDFPVENGSRVEVILTNKHVVENNKTLHFLLHEGKEIGDKIDPLGTSFPITIEHSKIWIPHPSTDVDLGAILFVPIRETAKKNFNKTIYTQTFSIDLIKTDTELHQESDVANEAIMVGYPIGLWDEKNNFPIVRKGITASHPSTDFNKKSLGVVDIACFPGSSGSPIIYYQYPYTDKKGNLFLGQTKILLLGLLSCGPAYTSQGRVEIRQIPTTNTSSVTLYDQMIHLGYYVKAKEILALWEHMKSRLNIKHPSIPA